MKTLFKTAAVLAAISIPQVDFTGEANAGSRKATPPPVTLSPDLNSPWVLQLKPKRRRATRRALARAKRPNIKVYRRQGDGASIQTASIRRNKNGLRRSIQPKFNAELLPTVVSYDGNDRPGTIVVNTVERRLYMVLKNGMARRYAIGVGKPGFEWNGTHKVTRKAEWPDWRPPKEMIEREKKKGRILPTFMEGGPTNPMGARALYLGSTIYRIHGTTQNWSIGQAVSSGCIRMRNEDVMDLYDRIPVVQKCVLSSQFEHRTTEMPPILAGRHFCRSIKCSRCVAQTQLRTWARFSNDN